MSGNFYGYTVEKTQERDMFLLLAWSTDGFSIKAEERLRFWLKQGDGWVVKAAGPTTSSREEPYQATILEKYGVRAVVGKGGMGAKTLAALKKCGAVYLNGIGGAAQFYARTVEKVLGVHLLEFGIPEAMWHLKVNNFAAIVTMDANGNSLHADVEAKTGEALAALEHA